MDLDAFVEAHEQLGSVRAVHREHEITFHAARTLYLQAVRAGRISPHTNTRQPPVLAEVPSEPLVEGSVHGLETVTMTVPELGKVNRYLLTCAQNNTRLHEAVWLNLKALAAHYDATLIVSRITYVKHGDYGAADKANITGRGTRAEMGSRRVGSDGENLWWDPRIEPHVVDTRVELAPGLVWCGEMNIIPTAVRPLSGLEVYTGRKSGIFPHVKLAMESVASGSKYEATKFNYTTGTVTQRNYIQRKAGLKAEFHHCYGGLIVEVDSDGDWFVRQLNAGSDGTIYDLDVKVVDEEVSSCNCVENIYWGDVHAAVIDDEVLEAAWGEDGMLDTLRPKSQVMGDVFDFRSRNRHERNDPHRSFERHVTCQEDVEAELRHTGDLLKHRMIRPWCRTVETESNHDNMLERWLRDEPAWYTRDPKNALVFLELQLAKYEAMAAQDDDFLLIENALTTYSDLRTGDVKFLRRDESYIICKDVGGGVDCGMHGYLGINGARGSPKSFAKMGRRANVGHLHSAGIVDGIYVSGLCARLAADYVAGPSSHSHSHVVTYVNGKRAIVTMWRGKWRAVEGRT